MSVENLDALLKDLIHRHGSDLHLQVGCQPVFRINGDLIFCTSESVTSDQMESFITAILAKSDKKKEDAVKGIDLSYSIPGLARFRTNIYKQRGNFGIAMRSIPFMIPTMKDIGVPAVIEELASRPHGLILLTGSAGSGKSTTLAAIIDHVNAHRKAHIITIEDPIEFLHANKLSLIDQREVGRDTPSFSEALVNALREDPDVILVGEMRDLDTIANAVTAAETGHLVFATLHTNDVVQAVDRIIDVFPPHQQSQIRLQLSVALQGVISQVLVKKKDGSGLMAVFEVLVANHAVRNMIKESKTAQINQVIQTSRSMGMQLLKDSLKELYQKGIITTEEAQKHVMEPRAFDNPFETIETLFKPKTENKIDSK